MLELIEYTHMLRVTKAFVRRSVEVCLPCAEMPPGPPCGGVDFRKGNTVISALFFT